MAVSNDIPWLGFARQTYAGHRHLTRLSARLLGGKGMLAEQVPPPSPLPAPLFILFSRAPAEADVPTATGPCPTAALATPRCLGTSQVCPAAGAGWRCRLSHGLPGPPRATLWVPGGGRGLQTVLYSWRFLSTLRPEAV